MKTLHYNILYFVRKYLLKLNNVSDIQQAIRCNSTNLSLLMSELCSCLCLKLYSLNFAIALAQKKIVMLIRIRHTCVALMHNKTVLSLETSSEINFEEFLAKRHAISIKETFVLYC